MSEKVENTHSIKPRYDSSIEIKIDAILKKYINSEHYSFSDHVTLPKIFKNYENTRAYKIFQEEYSPFLETSNINDDSTKKQIQRLDLQKRINEMEYDFVIYEKKYSLPVLFIEINGTQHLKEDSKIRDAIKSSIAREYNIPIINLELFTKEDDAEIERALKRELNNKTIAGACPVYCPDSECRKRMRIWWKNHNTSKPLKLEYYYCNCPECQKKNGKSLRVYDFQFIPPFDFNDKLETAIPNESSFQNNPNQIIYSTDSAITASRNIYLLEGKYYCGNKKCPGTPFISLGIHNNSNAYNETQIIVCEIDVTTSNAENVSGQLVKESIPPELWEYINNYYLKSGYVPTFYRNFFLECKPCNNRIYASTNIYNNIPGITDTFLSIFKQKKRHKIVKYEKEKAYTELSIKAYPLENDLALNWYKTNISINYPYDKIVMLKSQKTS